MKKILFTLNLLLFATYLYSQPVTVSLGPGYANQVWYSLQDGVKATEPKSNWDIAFDVTGFGSSIHTNSANGVMLWVYPNGDSSAWSTLDTTGIATWTPAFNSDTSWKFGAFDMGINASDPYDVGWGVYNMVTHITMGDSIFVIKLSNNSYKKIFIESLAASTYSFRYASLDGSNLVSTSLQKTDYADRYAGYYSLTTNSALNREPVDTLWDLLFTQYTAFVPTAYTVAGVLSSRDAQVARVGNLSNTQTYNDWETQSFSLYRNVIGYNWKSFNGTSFDIEDSTVYFVKTNSNDIWKLIFTGFLGSSSGDMMFTKEKLSATGLVSANNDAPSFTVYPNPSNESSTLIYDIPERGLLKVALYDITGKMVYSTQNIVSTGFFQNTISVADYKPGIYFVEMSINGKSSYRKLIVN